MSMEAKLVGNVNSDRDIANKPHSSKVDKLNEISFITWNIDGINSMNRKQRTEAVANILNKENATIVLLQEVISMTENILREKLPQYEFFSGQEKESYYTVTLIYKDIARLESNEIIEYGESKMGRNLLKTRVKVGETLICLLNTHLESMKQFSEIRMDQLMTAFEEVVKASITETVIFAGDLNIRDFEMTKVGLPTNVVDVWIETGSREEVQYTWDMTLNDNLDFDGWRLPRLRFDRVFMRASTPVKMHPTDFRLIGQQRIKYYVCFPSDHFGIFINFKIDNF